MGVLSLYFGHPVPYAIRLSSPNGLSIEIPAGAVLSAGPGGEVLADGRPVIWSDAPIAPGPRILCDVPAGETRGLLGIDVSAVRIGDVLTGDGVTHGGKRR
ncbi:MAG: hypothetical protein EPN98_21630 [Phenylobacterium sp.]|uniref:hypothetical protein n=1 Tax=Phenylobacterium sp. TaxID=1871053 RepID=UPI001204214A|nr:hypothetical protein [Phenylobacterium sp.]TAL29046.1 MAG: hypothetical protein EPN98_21630 [Phenylobacterium sp.]